MATCSKCGIQIQGDDVYTVKNEDMCEDCMMKYQSPSKPCGGGPGGAQPS